MTAAPDLASLDAVAQAELVRGGQASPLELVDAAIARIERTNPLLNAVIHTQFERARELAKRDALPRGPFRGVPLLMKDIGGQAAGDPCHAGSKFLRDAKWMEREDSHLTAKLRAAGFVLLGRTNTPELAILPTTEPEAYGATRNPFDPTRTAGGSSGGAAAAVAAGMVPAAHASDGGGSIRIPASHCGLVGLKPTRGRCSFGPGMGERWSGCSSEHVVTRTVRDTAAILDVVHGAMPGDPYSAAPPSRPFFEEVGAEPGRLRIGWMTRGPRGIEVHAESARAAEKAAHALSALGHQIETAYPAALDENATPGTFVTLVATNVARALDGFAAKVGRPVTQDDVEPLTWALAGTAREFPALRYLESIEAMHALGRRLAAWWAEGFDLLLTPTAAAPPPLLGHFECTREAPLQGYFHAAPFGAFTLPFNMSGQPAISLPVHETPEGLPVGVQLVAATGREDLLLRVAAQLEASHPWRERRARIHA